MTTAWRRLGRGPAILAIVAGVHASPASAARIDSSPTTVEINGVGAAGAYGAPDNGDVPRQLFDGTDRGLRIHFPGRQDDALLSAVAEGPVVRDGDVQRVDTTYTAADAQRARLEVVQTTSVRDGDPGFSVSYRIRNVDTSPVAFRVGLAAPMAGWRRGMADFEDGPPRFAGDREWSRGAVRGAEEVAGSPWTGWRHEFCNEAESWLATDEPAVYSGGGSTEQPCVAIAWDDHLAAGDALPPGDTASYAIHWTLQHGAAVAAAPAGGGTAILGHEATVDVQARDASGGPLAGVQLRALDWGSSRVDASTVVTDADGRAQVPIHGDEQGFGEVAVWLDQDGDGRLGPSEPRGVAETFWTPRLPLPGPTQAFAGPLVAVTTVLYDEAGHTMADRPVHWTVTGANPFDATGRTDYYGSAGVVPSARAGKDRVDAYADLDGDGAPGPDEPSGSTTLTRVEPAPGLQLLPSAAGDGQPVGSTETVWASVRSADGTPESNAPLLWFGDGGVQDSGSTNADGITFGFWRGLDAGPSTLTVIVDRNRNREADPGEPRASLTIDWFVPARGRPPADAAVTPVFERPVPGPPAARGDSPSPGPAAGPPPPAAAPPGLQPSSGAPPPRALVLPAGLPSVGRVVIRGRRTLWIALGCPASTGRCRGTAQVFDRRRRVRVGHARFDLAPGVKHTVTVRVRRSVRAGTRLLIGGAGTAVVRVARRS
ncbi:MAG: hypothetical protein QOE28_2293 [Solirubrobacteraceae bacterium]|jgi:hypothetical protein|nr:hypothetical protein [Solirubrobacteraceae bacterium]